MISRRRLAIFATEIIDKRNGVTGQQLARNASRQTEKDKRLQRLISRDCPGWPGIDRDRTNDGKCPPVFVGEIFAFKYLDGEVVAE